MHDASSCDQFPVLQYAYPLSVLCENKMPCITKKMQIASFDHLCNHSLYILTIPMATALHDERLSIILTAILQHCKQTTKQIRSIAISHPFCFLYTCGAAVATGGA